MAGSMEQQQQHLHRFPQQIHRLSTDQYPASSSALPPPLQQQQQGTSSLGYVSYILQVPIFSTVPSTVPSAESDLESQLGGITFVPSLSTQNPHQQLQKHHERVAFDSNNNHGTKHKNEEKQSAAAQLSVRAVGRIICSKPFCVLFTTVFLATSSGGCTFFYLRGWLQLPILTSQIAQLNQQVSRLQEQNDRFETLNEQLEQSNQQLNATLFKLQDRVHALRLENERYSELNTELQSSNDQLNQTSFLFSLQLHDLTKENAHYQKLNADLTSVVSFLNTTATKLDESLESVAEHLSQQIQTQQTLVVGNLEILFWQRITNWDCQFYDYFRGEIDNGILMNPSSTPSSALSGGKNDNPTYNNNNSSSMNVDATESKNHLAEVLQYVDEHVLSDLCLEMDDFVQFLKVELQQQVDVGHGETANTNQTLPSSTAAFYSISLSWSKYDAAALSLQGPFIISVDWFTSRVQRYTTFAMEYYFPDTFIDSSSRESGSNNKNGSTVDLGAASNNKDETNNENSYAALIAVTASEEENNDFLTHQGLIVEDWVGASFSCQTLPETACYRMYKKNYH